MNILIAAATAFEIDPAIEFVRKENFRLQNNEISILITGVGGVATTYKLSKSLVAKRPDYIIQAGIAGTFDEKLEIGTVVCVEDEMLGDLGAEEKNEFNDVFDLGLMDENEVPFNKKVLRNPFKEELNRYGLPIVKSIGINEITTSKQRIDLLRQKYNPAIESMEGVAFHYVCLQEKVRFLQLRAISNVVGERDKNNWDLRLAIQNLNTWLIDFIQSI
ncbi:MAG: futalosine hydrolase [Flavitalea sp.]